MKTFETMSKAKLREYLNGCHKAKSYDAMFEYAVRVYNNRFR